jgi:pilus assembly protein Flp/PilA
MRAFIKLLRDESGASAAEYALILAIVGTGIAIAAIILGGAIGNAMNSASNCINAPSSGTCGAAAATGGTTT